MVKPKQGCSNHRRSMEAGDLAPLVTEFMAIFGRWDIPA
jgi:hypothetical protein